jgi:2,4-diketo-3-deoxy-L-fuconate hydrolase
VKLVRYGKNGFEKPGLVDAEGKLRDLSKHVANIDESVFSPAGQKRLKKIDIKSLPIVTGVQRYGVPLVGISKFIGIGLNYADHAAEAGMPLPKEPIIFMKATTSISGPSDDVVQPPHSTKLDWEVELGIVIGTSASYVSIEDAHKYIAGYVTINDVSERQFQIERGTQWDKGKGCDTFGPIGPYLVTADEVADPQKLNMWLDVNGEAMQRGSTSTMVFGCMELVSYCSHYMTLRPGDVIATGTPPGVGMGMKPQRFLKAGDVITLGVEGLGEQKQRVVKPR